MKKTLYILTFLLIISTTYSQKDYHNWVFGLGCYITFNTPSGDPKFVDSLSINVDDNSGVISNHNGELQFYSFGNFLYNSEDKLIDNTVDGALTSRQGVCMFRVTDNHYIRVGSNYGEGGKSSLSFVKIMKNGGQEIVSEKKVIDSTSSSEGLQIFKNNLTNEIFLLTPDINNAGYHDLKLYQFQNNTFELKQVLPIPNEVHFHYIKYSPLNRLIVGRDRNSKELFFFRFNQQTNKIDTLIKNSVVSTESDIMFMEFSPSGEYLYVGNWFNPFRVSGLNRIEDGEITIEYLEELKEIVRMGNLELGPNGKIYIANAIGRYLSSIENPDNSSNIGFVSNSVYLENTLTSNSLPNIPTSFYDIYDFKDSILVCNGDNIILDPKMNFEFDNTTYVWKGPNGFKSDLANPIIENAELNDSGTYIAEVYNSDSSINYIRELIVNVVEVEDPIIVVSPDSIVCNANEVKLSVVGIYENFEWTTSETTLSITVTESGTYGVEHINDNGCVGYSEVNIKFGDDINTDIIGPTVICEGSGEIYSADRDYETYKWSNGDDTKTTLISEAGTYWLEVTTVEGCTISDTIDISYHPQITAELNSVSTTICKGDSVQLESVNDFPYYSYEWNTGATTRGIYVKETGTYKLTITDTRTGCMDSTEIAISVEDNLQPTINGMDICAGNPATLEALPNDPSYSYEWSNGETTPTIVVNQPEIYTVTVSKDGCTGTTEFTVNESPNPEFEILGDDIVCGNTATLSPNNDFAEYLWSTDEVTKEIEVTESGTYSLTVTDENGCIATEEFTVNEQSLSFDISKDRIDFGKVYISETAIDSVEIINTSGIELTITDGTQNYIIPNGFPVEYTKTLDPTELGPYTDSFEYRVISPCDTVITIPVTAEVYAIATISSDNIETEIGKEESIPVYLKAEADLGEQTYTITTDVDKTVLFTEDDYTFTRTAPINKAKTLIHEINGTIMLANELEYDITFPSYEFNNPYIEVNTEQGKLTIDSVCAFPMRSVTITEAIEMKVSPNPARDRLVVDIISEENTIMTLELISSEGRVTYIENWTQTSSERQLSINTDKIPSGLYQVRLLTPSGVLTENVIVVR